MICLSLMPGGKRSLNLLRKSWPLGLFVPIRLGVACLLILRIWILAFCFSLRPHLRLPWPSRVASTCWWYPIATAVSIRGFGVDMRPTWRFRATRLFVLLHRPFGGQCCSHGSGCVQHFSSVSGFCGSGVYALQFADKTHGTAIGLPPH